MKVVDKLMRIALLEIRSTFPIKGYKLRIRELQHLFQLGLQSSELRSQQQRMTIAQSETLTINY